MMQRYAGTVSVRFSALKGSSRTPSNIRKPTMIRAGAVAKEGMAVKRGEKRQDRRKSVPVVIAVSPVRPPDATPADDSTNVDVVDVPRMAPQVVAILLAETLPVEKYQATPLFSLILVLRMESNTMVAVMTRPL